jgi:hypothetical protein
LDEDTIMARMEAGSLVVPRPVAWMMKHYPGKYVSEKKKPMNSLEPVVVMPNEVAVPRKYASQVERWLLDHGISLPIPQGWDVKKKMYPSKRCGDDRCGLCLK